MVQEQRVRAIPFHPSQLEKMAPHREVKSLVPAGWPFDLLHHHRRLHTHHHPRQARARHQLPADNKLLRVWERICSQLCQRQRSLPVLYLHPATLDVELLEITATTKLQPMHGEDPRQRPPRLQSRRVRRLGVTRARARKDKSCSSGADRRCRGLNDGHVVRISNAP